MGVARRAVRAGLIALLLVLGGLLVPTGATAATGDIGYVGPSYTGATDPTADKPQSKLWFHDGRWWADMFDTVSQDWHIFYLDRATEKWVDTQVAVDTRPNTSADALWDGTTLSIGTHVVRTGSNSSSTSAPMYLYRYTYDSTAKKFVPAAGTPRATISSNSSESLTIDKDSTGTVWATWTKVSGTSNQVFLNSGTSNGTSWGTPFVVPTTGGLNNPNVNPNVAVDDISAIVAFGNKVGVLWSNQNDGFVYWSIHNDNAPRTNWTGGFAVKGSKIPDDHLNIKSVAADANGRVFAAVKTSLDKLSGHSSSDPQINLLQYKFGTGGGNWTTTTFGRISDCHTRAQVVLDEQNQKVYVFATGKTGTGTCTSNGDGAIYMKSTSMGSPSFATGSGTMIMRDAASENLNNVTATKQSVTSASGVVVLASNDVTKRYWHADVVPGSGGTTPPPAADTTAPSVPSGVTATANSATSVTVGWTASTDDTAVASYQVKRGGTVVANAVTGTSFTDTGLTASTQYSYTVSAVDAAGNRSAESAAKTVTTPSGGTTPPPPSGSITEVDSTTAGSAATTTVTVAKPSGLADGDVLVAQITADAGPTIATPAGWAVATTARTVGTSAKLFAFYRVVTNAASEPASYSWTTSTAVKWNAGIAAFRGVDTATVWVSTATGATNTTAASSLTVPTPTTTSGALLVGGVALNSSSVTVTPPSSWTENLEASGQQVTEVASGTAGTATWTYSSTATSTGWARALKPKA